jgi:hypothetical protein
MKTLPPSLVINHKPHGQDRTGRSNYRVQILFRMIFTGLLVLTAPTTWAEFTVLSGTFYGSEPVARNLHEACRPDPEDDPYMVVDKLTVSQSGTYRAVSTTSTDIDATVWFGIYQGAFDPSAPRANQIAEMNWVMRTEWDFDVAVSLVAGTEYSLVVSPSSPCVRWIANVHEQGVWTMVFSGPGEVNSPATVSPLDSFLQGEFDGTGPTADLGCGDREYHETGAQQVDTSGTYYITKPSLYFDLGTNFQLDICISIYTEPFDPQQPDLNRILRMKAAQPTGYYASAVDLNAGQDYYFVVSPAITPWQRASKGEYFFLVTPGTDVYIDPVLSGSWYDPETSGQGFFFDILGQDKLMTAGWFTYDQQRPAADAQATIGDAGHRWLTALGTFSGNRATLDLEVTTGGIFNEGNNVHQVVDGSLEIEFFDCNTGQVSFDLGSVGRQGVIPIRRVSNSNSRACENLMRGSGTPRLLNRNR